jgi:hypothetical protein
VNHSANGKKYLYDILNIKKETSRPQHDVWCIAHLFYCFSIPWNSLKVNPIFTTAKQSAMKTYKNPRKHTFRGLFCSYQ